ncbi:MAG: PD-(D/E)XK nuclease family protein [Anaerolineales bacterium]
MGLLILNNICGQDLRLSKPQRVNISSQVTTEEGKPDIVIKEGNEKIVFIEVKHDSSLGLDQLERYYAHLEGLQTEDKQLVLLTRSRHSVQETTLDPEKFHHVCWYEISGWLSEADIHDDIAGYLVEQFLDFLKEKEMSMEKVTWEYIRGVPAMTNLVNMIATALSEIAPETGTQKTMGASWAGFYMEGIFIGFRYATPLMIVFENDRGYNPTFKRDLSLEKAHFFSLSAGEQLECLIEFIQESLEELEQK